MLVTCPPGVVAARRRRETRLPRSNGRSGSEPAGDVRVFLGERPPVTGSTAATWGHCMDAASDIFGIHSVISAAPVVAASGVGSQISASMWKAEGQRRLLESPEVPADAVRHVQRIWRALQQDGLLALVQFETRARGELEGKSAGCRIDGAGIRFVARRSDRRLLRTGLEPRPSMRQAVACS